MSRIWHPYWTWEDIGMWRDVSADEHRRMLDVAIEFTGNATAYGVAMLRVLDEFPIACEHNMTSQATNHQAWIGHAAAYLAHELPEYVTREAWGMLTQQQRDEANAVADKAINEWHERNAPQSGAIRAQMGFSGLHGWDAR
jgi:ATP/maltotriose-dependent transcriptional regulator MalT